MGLVQHPGIARRFLVETEGGMRSPGKRVEPLEAEQDKGEEVSEKVAAAMMRKLMLEREAALAVGEFLVEIERQDDDPVEDPEGQGAANPLRPHCDR